jgi:hypothetical protein
MNGNGNLGAPTIGYLRRFAVNRPGQPEVIRQRFYDHLLYPTAGVTQLTFFALPQGQGITTALGAAVGGAKTLADTNMKLAGQLPALVNFVIQSIEVTFESGGSAAANTFINAPEGEFTAVAADATAAPVNDKALFYKSGWLELNIGNKNYLTEAPLGSFPPKVQTVIDAAVGTNSATTGVMEYRRANQAGRPYFIDPALSLMSNQNFAVTLNWPGVVATPSGFNGRVGVILDGFTYRASQ